MKVKPTYEELEQRIVELEQQVIRRPTQLRQQEKLLAAIREAQNLFISGADSSRVYAKMLHILITHTESTIGFLDEVLYDPDGTPYKLSLAITDISWDEASRSLYSRLVERKLEFRNLNNLSGAPVLEGRTIIANDVPAHPWYQGLPKGHPPLINYMGVPLYFNGRIVGVAGIANRPEGYTEDIAASIAPLTQTCAAMIWAGRMAKRDRETNAHFEMVFNMTPDAAQITRLSDGAVTNINAGASRHDGDGSPKRRSGRRSVSHPSKGNPLRAL